VGNGRLGLGEANMGGHVNHAASLAFPVDPRGWWPAGGISSPPSFASSDLHAAPRLRACRSDCPCAGAGLGPWGNREYRGSSISSSMRSEPRPGRVEEHNSGLVTFGRFPSPKSHFGAAPLVPHGGRPKRRSGSSAACGGAERVKVGCGCSFLGGSGWSARSAPGWISREGNIPRPPRRHRSDPLVARVGE
jgi:hypothetical protein